MNSTLNAHLLEIVDKEVGAGGIPGVACLIDTGREVIVSKGCGYRNLNENLPMARETVTPICSLTELATNTAVTQFLEMRCDLPPHFQGRLYRDGRALRSGAVGPEG